MQENARKCKKNAKKYTEGKFVKHISGTKNISGKSHDKMDLEFESLETAIAAYNSPDYQAALKALDGGADRDIRIFEGK